MKMIKGHPKSKMFKRITAWALYEKNGDMFFYGTLPLNIYADKSLAESRSKVMKGTRVVEVEMIPTVIY